MRRLCARSLGGRRLFMDQELEHIPFTSFIQEDWFENDNESSIWISAFRIVGVEKRLKKLTSIKGARSTIAFLYGSLKYLNIDFTEVQWKDEQPFIKTDQGIQETDESNWLLIIVPYEIDGQNGNESETRDTVSFHAGLAASILGENVVHEKVFDNIINIGTGRKQAFSSSFRNPFVNSSPVLSDECFNQLDQAFNKISSLPEPEQNRLSLALNWHFDAINDSGKEGFIKSWIAIEILQMPNTTNIRPVKKALVDIYEGDLEEVERTFKVGRLFGLRSRIVHDGENVPIHYLLKSYVQSIFIDILYWKLDLSIANKAKEVLDRSDFNIDAFLHEK